MNRISRMGVLLFLVSVAPGALGSAQAQPVEELTVDITSAGLVKKVRAAVGDESAWSAVRTLRVTGTIDFAGQTLAIDGIESQGDLTVTTLRSGGEVQSVEGCDGTISWEKTEGSVIAHEGAELSEGLDDCAFMSQIDLTHYKEIKVAGKARQGSATFYLVDAFTKRGNHDVLTIDGDTFLPKAAIVQRHDEGQKITMVSVFSDYRPVAGLLYPHTVNMKIGNAKGAMKLTSVVASAEVDPAVFKKPTK